MALLPFSGQLDAERPAAPPRLVPFDGDLDQERTAAPRPQPAGPRPSSFDAEGTDYDYDTARGVGMGPAPSGENVGHWGSVAPAPKEARQQYGLPEESYVVLKGRNHNTWNLAVQGEEERGYKVVKFGDRYYSVPAASAVGDSTLESVGQNVAEFFKGPVPGAVGMGGSIVSGAGALTLGGSQETLNAFDQIDRGEFQMPEAVLGHRKIEPMVDAYYRQPERRQEYRERFQGRATGGREMMQAGQDIQATAKTIWPAAPGYEESPGRQLGEGMGSLLTGVATSLVPIVGPVAAAGAFTLSGAGEAADRAIQAGATEDQIVEAARLGTLPGLTDSLPVETLLGRIPIPGAQLIRVPANLLGAALKAVGRIGWQAFVEGVQESGQTFLQNLIAREVYKPEQSLTEGMPGAAAVGSGVGGLAETGRQALTSLTGRRGRSAGAPQAQPAPMAPQEPPPPPPPPPISTTHELADLIADPRPVDEIKAAQEKAAADAAKAEAKAAADALDAQRVQAGLPQVGQDVALRLSDGQVISGKLGTLIPMDGGLGLQVTTEDGTTLETYTDEATVIPPAEGDGTRESPVKVEAPEHVDVAAEKVDPAPTPAQKEAGNYQKGHVKLDGLDISIENPEGSERTGIGPDGQPWSVTMRAHYGYIKRSEGADGDQVDVYIGPDPESQNVFVIDQADLATGAFDEAKVILGVNTRAEAQQLYDDHFSDGRGPQRRKATSAMSMPAFKEWLKSGSTKKPINPDAFARSAPVPADMEQRRAEGPQVSQAPGGAPIPDLQESIARVQRYVAQTKGRLIPKKVAKATGLPPEVAMRALAELAAKGADIRQTPAGFRRVTKDKGEQDLLRFLAARGGIQDTEGHDLARGRGAPRMIPGIGALIRPGGMSMDRAREIAVEAKYLPEGATIPDFLEALDNAFAGTKVFKPDRVAETDQGEIDDANERFIHDAAAEIGLELTEDEVKAVKQAVADGLDIEDALEAAVVQTNLAGAQAAVEKQADIGYIPFEETGNAGSQVGSSSDGQMAAGQQPAQGDTQGAPEGNAPGGQEHHSPGQLAGTQEDVERDRLLEIPADLRRTAGEARPAPAPVDEKPSLPAPITAKAKPAGNIDAIRQAKLNDAKDAIYVRADELGITLGERQLEKLAARHLEKKTPIDELLKGVAQPTTEKVDTVDGVMDQAVLPGAEKISDRQLAERRMQGRKQAKADQKGVGGLDLFDPDSRATAQEEMFSAAAPMEDAPERRISKPLTSTEKVFFDEITRDVYGLIEDVPSFRYDGNTISFAWEDADAFGTFILDSIIADGAMTVPPRLRNDTIFAPQLSTGERFTAKGAAGPSKKSTAPVPDQGRPVAVITGHEYPNQGTDAVRKAGRKWGYSHLMSTKNRVETSDGKPVRITKTSIKHALRHNNLDRMKAFWATREVLERGRYLGSSIDTSGDVNVKSWRYYAAPILVEGKRVNVIVTLREDEKGELWLYDHTIDLGTPRPPAPASFPGNAAREQVPGVGAPGTENVSARDLSGKGEPFRELRQELDRLGLTDVSVNLVKRIERMVEGRLESADGRFVRKLIEVAMYAPDRIGTLHHEAFHALKKLGLITDKEWAVLARKARSTWIKEYGVRKAYPGASLELLEEEAAARGLELSMKEGKPGVGRYGRIFQKIKNIIEAMGNWVRGLGYKTANDVFKAIENGEIGNRPRGAQRRGGERFAARPAPTLFSGSFAFETKTVRDFLTDRNLSALERLKGAAGIVVPAARVKLQDRFLTLRRLQEHIAKVKGAPIGEDVDAYLAEELYHGRTGKQLDDFKFEHVEPLIQAIRDEKLTLADVELYLYARHAPERNAQITKINDQMPDGGSGMTNAEAAHVMGQFQSAGLTAKLQRIAARIDAIIKDANDIRVQGGLMDDRLRKRWDDTYKHYVPLRGWENQADAHDEVGGRGNKTGKGFDIRGQESQRALGRTTKAGDILANVLAQYEEAVVRAEKNMVGRTLIKLIEQNPDPALWEIDVRAVRRVVNKQTGMVEPAPDPFYSRKENVLAVKVGGKVHYITIHHPGLARSMKNLGAEEMNNLLRTMQTFTRYLAFINTSLNPEFVLSNFIRDLQTAGINIQQYRVPNLTRSIMKDIPAALRGAFGGLRGKKSSPWEQHFHEYADAGGKIAFFGLDTIEQRGKAIQKMMAEANGDRQVRKVFRKSIDMIQEVNGAVENAVRLATFVNLRREGVSVKQAASVARNLTVNFNRKGEWGPEIGALYLFFNAGVQGTAIMFQALTHKRVRRMAYGIVLFSAMIELLNAAMSPEDDDEEKVYDKINGWTKDHNLILVNPYATKPEDAIALKLPMPYGYNVLSVLGQNIGHMARPLLGVGPAKKSAAKAAADVLFSALSAFNPLGGVSTVAQFIAPTPLKPLVEVSENKNFAGQPIYPDANPFAKVKEPASERYWNSVSKPAKWIAQKMNELTGGNEVRSGSVDVSPEILDHFYDFLTGGTGQFVKRGVDALSQWVQRKDVPWRNVPFARRLVEGRSEWADRQKYFEIRNKIETFKAEQKWFLSEGKTDEAKAAEKTYAIEKQLVNKLDSAERELLRLRGFNKKATDDKKSTDDKKEEQKKALQADMTKVMRSVIGEWNRLEEKKRKGTPENE